jgi:hypothetical protein
MANKAINATGTFIVVSCWQDGNEFFGREQGNETCECLVAGDIRKNINKTLHAVLYVVDLCGRCYASGCYASGVEMLEEGKKECGV